MTCKKKVSHDTFFGPMILYTSISTAINHVNSIMKSITTMSNLIHYIFSLRQKSPPMQLMTQVQ